MALKKAYSQDGKTCKVTFIVEPEANRGANDITISGDFNSWSSTETHLKKGKDGSFSVTLELETGKEYQYRYLFDGTHWENDWRADKYTPAPFSNTDNSVVICVKPEKAPAANTANAAPAEKKAPAKRNCKKK